MPAYLLEPTWDSEDMEHTIKIKYVNGWQLQRVEAVATFPVKFGAQINIVFIINA
jgi:hypothetical protein